VSRSKTISQEAAHRATRKAKSRGWAASAPGAGVGTGMQICIADLTGDGRSDIAVAGKSGTWLLVNAGNE
jgi:hypothetical protein